MIDVVGIYNRDGMAIAHTDRSLIGKNLSNRDFISAALRGEAFTSGIRRDLVNDQLGMNFSLPIKEQSTIVGAMAIHIDGNFFSQVLNASVRLDEPNAITLYLIDPNGIVMSQSQKDDLLYRSLGTLTPEAVRRIAEVKPLGGACSNNQIECLPRDKIARQPEPLPALQPLGDQVLAAFVAGRAGSIRFCRPYQL